MIRNNIKRECESVTGTYCPICEGFTKTLNKELDADEIHFEVPSHLGHGSSRRLKLGEFIEINFNNINLSQEVQMSGKTEGNAYIFLFCLGESMQWQETISGQTIELEKGSGTIQHVGEINEVGTYQTNRHYQGITLLLRPEKFRECFSSVGSNDDIFSNKYINYNYSRYTLPSESKIIITEALHCPYIGVIKKLYLEGKIMELIAVCMNAILMHNMKKIDQIELSRTDMESINQAKKILDNSVSSPISIAALARLVCLNESKLKRGFKHVYGSPVYTYLIDKRMEMARILLETEDISIAQVAEFVGYDSRSSFSKAFSKKYGFYPREYADTIKIKIKKT